METVMNKEAEMAFISHDWENDKEWQEYITNLYPTPKKSQLARYKRRYFNLKHTPIVKIAGANVTVTSNDKNFNYFDRLIDPWNISKLLLSIGAFFTILSNLPYNDKSCYIFAQIFNSFALLMMIYAENAPVCFTKEYYMKLVEKEAFKSIFIPTTLISFRMAIVLNYAVLGGLFCLVQNNKLPSILNNFKPHIKQYGEFRGVFEIVIIPIAIFSVIFMRKGTVFNLFLYLNYLKGAYTSSKITKQGFMIVNQVMMQNLAHKNVPFFIKKLYYRFTELLYRLASNSSHRS